MRGRKLPQKRREKWVGCVWSRRGWERLGEAGGGWDSWMDRWVSSSQNASGPIVEIGWGGGLGEGGQFLWI